MHFCVIGIDNYSVIQQQHRKPKNTLDCLMCTFVDEEQVLAAMDSRNQLFLMRCMLSKAGRTKPAWGCCAKTVRQAARKRGSIVQIRLRPVVHPVVLHKGSLQSRVVQETQCLPCLVVFCRISSVVDF